MFNFLKKQAQENELKDKERLGSLDHSLSLLESFDIIDKDFIKANNLDPVTTKVFVTGNVKSNINLHKEEIANTALLFNVMGFNKETNHMVYNVANQSVNIPVSDMINYLSAFVNSTIDIIEENSTFTREDLFKKINLKKDGVVNYNNLVSHLRLIKEQSILKKDNLDNDVLDEINGPLQMTKYIFSTINPLSVYNNIDLSTLGNKSEEVGYTSGLIEYLKDTKILDNCVNTSDSLEQTDSELFKGDGNINPLMSKLISPNNTFSESAIVSYKASESTNAITYPKSELDFYDIYSNKYNDEKLYIGLVHKVLQLILSIHGNLVSKNKGRVDLEFLKKEVLKQLEPKHFNKAIDYTSNQLEEGIEFSNILSFSKEPANVKESISLVQDRHLKIVEAVKQSRVLNNKSGAVESLNSIKDRFFSSVFSGTEFESNIDPDTTDDLYDSTVNDDTSLIEPIGRAITEGLPPIIPASELNNVVNRLNNFMIDNVSDDTLQSKNQLPIAFSVSLDGIIVANLISAEGEMSHRAVVYRVEGMGCKCAVCQYKTFTQKVFNTIK